MKKILIASVFFIFAMLSILLLQSFACFYDTECAIGSQCVKAEGSLYGVCKGGLYPGNKNDRQPVYAPLDMDKTYGNTCSYDTECGISNVCIKSENSIYGVCMKKEHNMLINNQNNPKKESNAFVYKQSNNEEDINSPSVYAGDKRLDKWNGLDLFSKILVLTCYLQGEYSGLAIRGIYNTKTTKELDDEKIVVNRHELFNKFNIDEIIKEFDKFYSKRANANLPYAVAFYVVAERLRGASEKELEKWLEKTRKVFK